MAPRESTSVTYQYLDAVLWQGKGEGVWVRCRHGRVHQLLTNTWTQCCGRGREKGWGEVPPRESTSVTYQCLDAVLWQGKGEGVWVRCRHGRVHQLLTNAWTQCCGRGREKGCG